MTFLKKYWTYIAITVALIGLLAAAYMNKQHTDNITDEQNSISKQAIDDELGYTPEDYITLGQYKGLEYNKSEVGVSDDELQEAINQELLDYRPVDRVAKEGDGVDVSYTAYIDGKKNKNLSVDNYMFILGDQELDESFDEKALGKGAGDTFTTDVVNPYYFPMNNEKDYSGVNVTFEVVINEINEPYYLELTDEWVKECYAEEGLNNVDEYKEAMKDVLYDEKLEESEQDVQNGLWDMVMTNCIMNGYPQELYDVVKDMDDWDVKYDAEEGIYITDDEIQEGFNQLYEEYGYESADDMKEEYSDYEIERALLENKIIEMVVENAIITEIPSVKNNNK